MQLSSQFLSDVCVYVHVCVLYGCGGYTDSSIYVSH